MRRRHYLEQLLRQRHEWLHGSMAEPTRHMTRTHVLLHAVALRRLRALGPNAAGNRLALQGQSELTGLLGV